LTKTRMPMLGVVDGALALEGMCCLASRGSFTVSVYMKDNT
jgi:hypothetical protein